MQPHFLQPVFFDARNHKLLGKQKNGRYEHVDVNPLSRGLSAGQDFFLLKPNTDSERFLDVDVPANKHYLFHIVDQNIAGYDAEINSTYTITNIGQGTLEVTNLDYNSAASVMSASGPLLSSGGSAVLRYLGNDKWHITGDAAATNALEYNVTVETVMASPSYLQYGLAERPSGSVVIAPTINLKINQELLFYTDVSGHPLWFKDAQEVGAGSTNGYIPGALVNNNGSVLGLMSFRAWRAGTFYYQCQFHNGMHGEIVVS